MREYSHTYQRVRLGLLEVVAPVQRVEPGVEEEFGPVPVAEDEAAGRQALLVLGHDKVNVVALEVRKGLDDAVRRDHGQVLDHVLLQVLGAHDVVDDVELGVHDERVLVQVPDVLGVWKLGQGVSRRRHLGPRHGVAADIVASC